MTPQFSIVISTYNRLDSVTRCVASCLRQTISGYEVVVVDDGSSDGTPEGLRSRWGSSIRVVEHGENRGINPARYTGVQHARGEWIVVLDSDWELMPHTLAALRDAIETLPDGVRVIRTRMQWDDGSVTPAYVPEGVVGYEDRVRFAADEGGSDAGRCLHRDVFAGTPYITGRRGAMEMLFELNLAKAERCVYLEQPLIHQHVDAPGSYLRSIDRAALIPRLRRDAPDMLWMVDTTLRAHGRTLEKEGPALYGTVVRMGVTQAFLAGRRRDGVRYAAFAVRKRAASMMMAVTTVLGLLGPAAVGNGVWLFRRLRAQRG